MVKFIRLTEYWYDALWSAGLLQSARDAELNLHAH